MIRNRILKQSVVGLVLVALSLVLVAPASYAGHRSSKRYKGGHKVVRVVNGYPVHCYPVRHRYPVRYVERYHSGAGPLIAGLIGGFVLGATLSNAAPPPVGYSYYDPYCHRSYASLEIYSNHLHYCGHPHMVRVIEVDGGDCVGTYHYRSGDWHSIDDGDGDYDDHDVEWDD